MGDMRRYVVKIYDRKLGGEYEFDSDFLDIKSEKSTDWSFKEDSPERHIIKLVKGFDNWEDFQNPLKVEELDE